MKSFCDKHSYTAIKACHFTGTVTLGAWGGRGTLNTDQWLCSPKDSHSKEISDERATLPEGMGWLAVLLCGGGGGCGCPCPALLHGPLAMCSKGYQSPAASANQNVTINILHEKKNEWPPFFFSRKVKHNNEAKGWRIPNKTLKINHGARSLTTTDISCDQRRQTPFL